MAQAVPEPVKLSRALTISSLSTEASSRSGDSSDVEGEGAARATPQLEADRVYTYPAGLRVRHTFLDFPLERPASLDDFVEDRRLRSAPGSRVLDDDEAPLAFPAAAFAAAAPPMQSPQLSPPRAVAGVSTVTAGTAGPAVLRLSALIAPAPSDAVAAPPLLGSAAMPTRGSEGHHRGDCKPCAFVWRADGCGNGIGCPFCHLCQPGEKKRRLKEKRASLRAGASALHQAMRTRLGGLLA